MKHKNLRPPFDHMKNIYGDNLEGYSYQEIDRDPSSSKKAFEENNSNRIRYESVRGKILDFIILVYIFFMLGVGVYFLLTSIAAA